MNSNPKLFNIIITILHRGRHCLVVDVVNWAIYLHIWQLSCERRPKMTHIWAGCFVPSPKYIISRSLAKTFRIRSPCCVINIRFIKCLQPNRSNGPNQVSAKHIVISNLFSNAFRIRSPCCVIKIRYIRIGRYQLFTTNLNYLFGMSATSEEEVDWI